MPSSHKIEILADTGDPKLSTQDCVHKDEIYWINNNAHTVKSFTLPSCVSPTNSPAPIAPGDRTQHYTVNDDSKKGKYPYYYEVDDDVTPRNGTINVA
jgi:hypothetical protein